MSVPKGTTELERVTDVIGLPWVGDREACAVAFQGRVACFDLGNGNQLWGRDMSSSSGLGVDARHVYVSEDRGAVSALERASGRSLWRQDRLTNRNLSAPLPLGAEIAVGDLQGFVHLLARDSGAFVGRIATDGSALRTAPVALRTASWCRPRAGRSTPSLRADGRASPASRSRSSEVKPTVVIVGRPNVGKSTLFNRLTRSRDALVADVPGLTRDRHYGDGQLGPRPYYVVDTGGLEPVAKDGLLGEMAKQTAAALAEADAIIFLVDAREGVTPQDRGIAGSCASRAPASGSSRTRPRVWTRPSRPRSSTSSGWASRTPISAAHGEGVAALMDAMLADFPPEPEFAARARRRRAAGGGGRPAERGQVDAGEPLLGEDRMIVFDAPGTTRDAIEVPFERYGRRYLLVDTAGVRTRGRVFESVEKFSVVKTMQAIDRANVVDPGRRCGGRHRRPGRASRRLHPRAWPRARGGREQVGWPR